MNDAANPIAAGQNDPVFREGPRAFLRRIGIAYAHRRIAQALAACGFDVKSVLRMDSHPVWKVTLTCPQAPHPLRARRLRTTIRRALAGVPPSPPACDLDVYVVGRRVTVVFLWEAPTPPGLLTLRPRGMGYLRQLDDGSWESLSI